MPASSLRLLRSLAWLRWRVLVNTLTRSGARDMLERLSRTAESLLPVAVAVMLLPLAVILLVLGGWTGWMLADDPALASMPLQLVRWALLAMCAITVLSPVIFSGTQQGAGILRLLLLPIPTRILYAAHAAGALADPWVFLSIPLLAGIPAGLALHGRLDAGLSMALAGAGFLATLLGLAALASAVLQLVTRNRRRAELFALGGMLLIVIISIVPSLVFTGTDADASRHTRRHDRAIALADWVRRPAAFVPSEVYVAAARDSSNGDSGQALARAVVIAALAVGLHALTWPIYGRLLQTPATSGARRRGGTKHARAIRLPFAGPAVSAIALTFTRLAYRTPRGRAVMLMPIVMLAGFAAISMARETKIPFGPIDIGGGYSLGIFGLAIALMSIGPLAFNQFAVDRAGLTLEFLSPVSTRELLYGKAIGGALIAATPAMLAIAAGIVTGAYSPLEWLAIVLGACAAYVLTAPAAAVLSLIFPRAVDLSSIGQASNAHQAAGLLGFLSLAASSVPPAGLAIAGMRFLHSPAAVCLLLALWLCVATGLSWVGFRIAERLLEERRENLAMVAERQ